MPRGQRTHHRPGSAPAPSKRANQNVPPDIHHHWTPQAERHRTPRATRSLHPFTSEPRVTLTTGSNAHGLPLSGPECHTNGHAALGHRNALKAPPWPCLITIPIPVAGAKLFGAGVCLKGRGALGAIPEQPQSVYRGL